VVSSNDTLNDTLCFALLSRDGSGFDEQKTVTASCHPVSAVCALPLSDGETLGRVAVASSSDHIVRIYRLDETNPLYQLEGHTDTGIAHLVVVLLFSVFGQSYVEYQYMRILLLCECQCCLVH